jgi:hypothetical protein
MYILKRFVMGFAACLCAIALVFLQHQPVDAMSPVFPTGDTVFNNAPLIFDPDTDVTWYEVRIVNNGQVKHQQWYEAAQVCNLTACYVNHGVDYSAGVGDQNLTWSYRGYNAVTDSVSAWVDTNFTLLAADPIGPTTVTEENGVTTLTVTEILDGSTVSEVPYYRIYLQNNADNSQVLDEWVAVDTCNMGTCTLDPLPKMLYNGNYTAWMQGYSLSDVIFGYTAWSEGFTFTVNGAAPTEAKVAVVGMLNNEEIEIDGETELLPTLCIENADPMLPTYTCGSTPLLMVGGAPLVEISRSLRQGEVAFDTVTRNLDETVTPRPEAVQVQVRQGTNVVFQQWYVFGVSPVCQFDSIPALCSVPLEGLTPGVEYNYRVRHYSASQPSPWAEDPLYTFEIGPNTDLTPATFTVNNNNAVLVILWEAGIGASWYEIVIEDTATNEVVFSQWREAVLPQLLESQFDGDDIGFEALYSQYVLCEPGDGCQAIVFPYLTNGNYTWKIRGWVEGELAAYSTPQAYNISYPAPEISTDPGDLDVQRTMIDVEGNTQPVFTWVADEGAQWFNLIVRRADSSVVFDEWFSFIGRCSVDEITNDPECGYQSPVNLAPGTYTYTLQAWGPGGLGPIIPAQDFTINGAIPPAPTLTAPTGDIADNYPAFTWQSATNASWYEVEIRRGGTVVHHEWIYRPVTRCMLSCAYAPEISLIAGAHTWRVRGASAGGVGPWSSGMQFNVTTPLEPATINSPGGTFYTGDITFSWEALENATYYGVTVYATDLDLVVVEDFVLGDAVYTQWFSAEELNCEFDDALIILLREGDQQQQRMASSTCEIVIPDATLPSGNIYAWGVSSWGPGQGSTVNEPTESELALFGKV